MQHEVHMLIPSNLGKHCTHPKENLAKAQLKGKGPPPKRPPLASHGPTQVLVYAHCGPLAGSHFERSGNESGSRMQSFWRLAFSHLRGQERLLISYSLPVTIAELILRGPDKQITADQRASCNFVLTFPDNRGLQLAQPKVRTEPPIGPPSSLSERCRTLQ